VATAGNLADVTSGAASSVLASAPNGAATSTYAEFNSLANLLASCVESVTAASCQDLMRDAAAPGASPPADTLAAAETIATHPANNVQALFGLSSLGRAYRPALGRAKGPDAWTLALTYHGNGMEFDGPGNMAVDKRGNIWVSNNYVYNGNPRLPACAGLQLLELTPTGQDAPGAPFTGGGVYGAGFGIAFDAEDTVWIGNFSFAGRGCTLPTAYSVSRFTHAGQAISPATGFTQGGVTAPQAIAFDQRGNLWIANDKKGADGRYSITVYTGGDPAAAIQLFQPMLNEPFAVAVDGKGNVWITNRGNNTVVEFAPNYTLAHVYGAPGTPSFGLIRRPLGVAIDSKNNAWVSNQDSYSVAVIQPSGQVTDFTGGGLTGPWGIAVDGADNVFVSNFGGKHYLGAAVTELCGSTSGACGPGVKRGDAISPATGFTSNALTRLTGVVVDQAGNLWVPDNWEKHEVQTNPGAHALVEFVGLAAPLLGPPQQP
jgi:sugar lactone lactonase YvrE